MMSSNSNSQQHICTLNTQTLSPPLSLSLSNNDDLFVDQLLNLNNNDDYPPPHVEEDDNTFLLTPSSDAFKLDPFHSSRFDFDFDLDHNKHDFGFVLSVPPAEEADLEWLSHFVEESFSQFSSPYPYGIEPNHPKPKPEPEPEPESPKVASFTSPPGLNRSRRSKRVWTRGRVSTTALPTSSSASSSSSGLSSPNPDPAQAQGVGSGSGSGTTRRCTHCGVQKTPQWRIGPLGPKSLCNACGVRYKSGRLFPEYRPACSPTFSSELHSNSHKKVLEMRKMKGVKISGRV